MSSSPFVGARTAYHYIPTKSPAYTNRTITRVTILAKTFTLQQTQHAHAHSYLCGITYQPPFFASFNYLQKVSNTCSDPCHLLGCFNYLEISKEIFYITMQLHIPVMFK